MGSQVWNFIAIIKVDYHKIFYRENAAKHESQARQSDFKAGFTGMAHEQDSPGPVGTNYVKTKPDIPVKHASNLRSKFEGMAKQTEDEARKKAEEEKKRREAKDVRDREEQRKNEEKRLNNVDEENRRREEARKAEADRLDRELEQKRIAEEQAFKKRDEEEKLNQSKERERQEKMEAEMKLREEKRKEEERLRQQERQRMQEEQARLEKEEQSRREREEQERLERERMEQEAQSRNIYDLPPEEDDNENKAGGISAIALYDYQANAEDEISFDPNDVITNIEMVRAYFIIASLCVYIVLFRPG